MARKVAPSLGSQTLGLQTLGSLALGSLALGLLALTPSACSDDGASCPACATGYACDPATRSCVPTQGGCPSSCGPNATCTGGTCGCLQGWTDCNGDRGNPAGNGCECDRGCQGTLCSGQTACTTDVVGICGDETRYCDGAACRDCAAGSYNCDGLGPCEATRPCRCDPAKPQACGGERLYCSGDRCLDCPPGRHNCDGLGECECERACFAGSCTPSCDPECTAFIDSQCVKDPAQGNRCVDCLDDSHCAANPRGTGPRCDTAANICVCDKNANCAESTQGLACRQVGEFLQCSCDTASDCPAPYTICEGVLIKHCVKPCTVDEDCFRVGVGGFCDKTSGECEFAGDF